ncbi:MAG: hypothetical protein EXX96DRAFT_633895 [Benjaminiella poitrasii]|nr:MAG: hypothetical protein EXX96DRAFT_633895 [Benjaminiella poitrasii]
MTCAYHLTSRAFVLKQYIKVEEKINTMSMSMSFCNEKNSQKDDEAVIRLITTQHPGILGCLVLNDGPRRYLEVYIHKSKDSNDIFENGLVDRQQKLIILPCRALPDSSKIVNIKLTVLPMLPHQEVLQGLKQSLKPFGNIIDVGINVIPGTSVFMGTGYAVLEISAKPEKHFQGLAHTIS